MTKKMAARTTADREVDEVATFMTWVVNSKPGERCTYHYGNLMRDRQYTPRGDVAKPGSNLDKLARAAMKAAEAGVVTLYQKRVDENICQYLAVKSSRAATTSS